MNEEKIKTLKKFSILLVLLSYLILCCVAWQHYKNIQEEITKYDIPYKPQNKTKSIYIKINKELKPRIVNESTGEVIQEIQAEPFEIIERK